MILHEVLTEAQVVVTEQLVEPSIEVGGEGASDAEVSQQIQDIVRRVVEGNVGGKVLLKVA